MVGCGFVLDLLLVCFRMWFDLGGLGLWFVGSAVYGCLLCTVVDVV